MLNNIYAFNLDFKELLKDNQANQANQANQEIIAIIYYIKLCINKQMTGEKQDIHTADVSRIEVLDEHAQVLFSQELSDPSRNISRDYELTIATYTKSTTLKFKLSSVNQQIKLSLKNLDVNVITEHDLNQTYTKNINISDWQVILDYINRDSGKIEDVCKVRAILIKWLIYLQIHKQSLIPLFINNTSNDINIDIADCLQIYKTYTYVVDIFDNSESIFRFVLNEYQKENDILKLKLKLKLIHNYFTSLLDYSIDHRVLIQLIQFIELLYMNIDDGLMTYKYKLEHQLYKATALILEKLSIT